MIIKDLTEIGYIVSIIHTFAIDLADNSYAFSCLILSFCLIGFYYPSCRETVSLIIHANASCLPIIARLCYLCMQTQERESEQVQFILVVRDCGILSQNKYKRSWLIRHEYICPRKSIRQELTIYYKCT